MRPLPKWEIDRIKKQRDWDKFFLRLAFFWGQRSCETSSKNGCIITNEQNVQLSQGYVGMPRGIEPTERRLNERPYKYFWHEHAERNAINNAARNGLSLLGSTFYITGEPCASCARGIVSVGARRVVVPKSGYFTNRTNDKPNADWQPSIKAGRKMFSEAGLDYIELDIGDLTELGENNPLVSDGSGPNI